MAADGLKCPTRRGLGIELNEKAFANNRGLDKKYRRELMFDADGNIAFPVRIASVTALAMESQHLRVFTHELGLDEKTKPQILCETPRRLGFAIP